MRIMFAADMSFSYFDTFPGMEKAYQTMENVTKLFEQADFSVVNLENALGNKEEGIPIIKSGPNLISDDSFIEYIHALKPDIIGLANNHTKDYGEDIMLHTIKLLENSGYMCIGAGKNISEAYKYAKVSKDGVQAAIIAVCENEFGVATEYTSGTAGYSIGRVTKAIKQALHEGCKPIIYFHGGNEENPYPSPGKIELYRHFIDLGAEAVIAMHTHCPQGYEYYNGKPIVYSMGNFFFPITTEHHKSWFYGYLSELNILEEKIELKIHPYKFGFDKVSLLEGDEKYNFDKYFECLCRPISNEEEIRAYFDSWCTGQDYIHILERYRRAYFSDGYAVEVKALKNLFGCEAHNELVENTFMMIFESRVNEAKRNFEIIRKLQEMECV